jgi:hypothetical protein
VEAERNAHDGCRSQNQRDSERREDGLAGSPIHLVYRLGLGFCECWLLVLSF